VKVRVTLEKADIIRLVLAHLETTGLSPVAGQDLKYKGALEVELLVEVGESTRVPMSTSETPTPTRKDAPVDDGQSITQVLAESARIRQVREEQANLTRRLAPNESIEFPRGGGR
jgi:hypothetical protein